ncbi:MAG: plasmid pRiA4b ORF-3 family protein [Dehalococcoidia bacterium]
MTSRSQRDAESIYQFKVTLEGIRPPIWRRLQVTGSSTLYDLHLIIQCVMGWEDYHLYEFTIVRIRYGEPDPDWETEVADASLSSLSELALKEKAKFSYLYDFGDYWEHEILVEKILMPEEGKYYPVCITGKRSGPPEDCGGIWGYGYLLEIISDPDHEEYQERIDWLGGPFDPEAFDVDEINQALRENWE